MTPFCGWMTHLSEFLSSIMIHLCIGWSSCLIQAKRIALGCFLVNGWNSAWLVTMDLVYWFSHGFFRELHYSIVQDKCYGQCSKGYGCDESYFSGLGLGYFIREGLYNLSLWLLGFPIPFPSFSPHNTPHSSLIFILMSSSSNGATQVSGHFELCLEWLIVTAFQGSPFLAQLGEYFAHMSLEDCPPVTTDVRVQSSLGLLELDCSL